MLAYSYSRYGSPDVLEQVTLPTPTPQPNEVLVKIHATTVSAGDWRARSLTMPKGLGFMGRLVFGITGPRKPVLGTEFSGVVAAVGSEVTSYQPGDEVIGFPGASFGAHAEFITMPSDGKLVRKPDNISFEQAAAIPFGGTTAYDFLVNKAKLQPGTKVLINGASGSVGSACVQIAKHLGAHVTAVCSAKNAQMVTGLGADQVIDYQTQNVITDGMLYDTVVDAVGTLPWAQARHALRPGGQMVLIAGKTSDMLFGSLKARLAGKRLIGGVASERREIIEAVTQLAAQGIFQPVIDRNYPFDEMKAAHAHVDTGHKCGNVVISMT
ncbi:NAD(P)-dependent alcohol dehydrogenase [Yoonia sp. I 8.24]|uniref:NAD(P)-dependent alcohol dehydrogenase n=1 Tax=Yoonia sp. I 8.24 TaxID=1537229 RepID=UPI001EDE3974|nr:NAD(P)-dependent alcohol dehydrogenase [Yoonia sp. I 8.24]MCG3268092.1 NAD(P)-dependent alcohol dehydrogenase [Yoonia sp. I 8.24]